MNERGMALVVMMFALGAIGAIIASTFLLGGLEQQMARTSIYTVQAGEAAETGLVNAMGVPSATYISIAEGAETTLENRAVAGPGRYTSSVLRLTSVLFLVRAIGERLDPDGQVLATDGRGLLLRLVPAPTGVGAAGPGRAEETVVLRPIRQRAWMPLY